MKEFEGAPSWATMLVKGKNTGIEYWLEDFGNDVRYMSVAEGVERNALLYRDSFIVLAVRARLATLPDANTRRNDEVLASEVNKYNRQCKGVTIDVYDVLQAFEVTNPALQHLVKKALCTGLRGHKNKQQDLKDILDSAKRAIELEGE